MKKIKHVDEHLVAHDTVTFGVATTLGVVAAAVTGEPEAGVAASGLLVAIGIGGMKVGPVRRTVNRAAIAVAEAKKWLAGHPGAHSGPAGSGR